MTKKKAITTEARLKKLGFKDVAIEKGERTATLTATFKDEPVTMKGAAEWELLEIAEGWIEHKK